METARDDSEQNRRMECKPECEDFESDGLESPDVEKLLHYAVTKDYRQLKDSGTSGMGTQSTQSCDSDEQSLTLSDTGTDEGCKGFHPAPRVTGGEIDNVDQWIDEILSMPNADSGNVKDLEGACSMENKDSPSEGQRNTTQGTPRPRKKQPKSRTGNRGIPYLIGLKNSVGKDVPKRDFLKCLLRRLRAIIMLILLDIQARDLDLLDDFIVDLEALLRYYRDFYEGLAEAIRQANSFSSAFVKRHFASEEARRLLEMIIEHDCQRSAEYLERTYSIEFADVTVLQFKRRFQKTPSEELGNSNR